MDSRLSIVSCDVDNIRDYSFATMPVLIWTYYGQIFSFYTMADYLKSGCRKSNDQLSLIFHGDRWRKSRTIKL